MSGGPLVRLRILVSGRVQGVWYRGAMAEQARSLGLAGWVRNLPDGRVEAVAEGPGEAVAALSSWCHQGPPAARVERVETSEENPEGLVGFDTSG